MLQTLARLPGSCLLLEDAGMVKQKGKARQPTCPKMSLKCFPENAAGSGDGRQGRSGELEWRVNQVFRKVPRSPPAWGHRSGKAVFQGLSFPNPDFSFLSDL